jgi:hypothetical protein
MNRMSALTPIRTVMNIGRIEEPSQSPRIQAAIGTAKTVPTTGRHSWRGSSTVLRSYKFKAAASSSQEAVNGMNIGQILEPAVVRVP